MESNFTDDLKTWLKHQDDCICELCKRVRKRLGLREPPYEVV